MLSGTSPRNSHHSNGMRSHKPVMMLSESQKEKMKFKTNAHFRACKDARRRLRKDYEKRCIAK